MIQKILGILKPFAPVFVTAAVILCCAAAPVLAEIPARKDAPDSSELDALLLQVAQAQAEDSETQTEEPAETTKPEKTKKKAETEIPAETLAAGTGNYEDGVYTGSGTGYGGTISVQVTVQDAQITDITILSAANESASFLSRAEGVISSILTAQTWEVDAVSGATYSSNGIKAAVKNALTGEVTTSSLGSTSNTGNAAALTQVVYEDPTGYVDGTYTGSAQGFGGTITVQVTIADGQITAIQVISAAGETASYLSLATSVLNTMLETQSPNVDAVSGATYSSSGIINATKNALSAASATGSEPADTEAETENQVDTQLPEDQLAETPEQPEQVEEPDSPAEPENPGETDITEQPGLPEEPAQTENPAVTTETSTETYTGYGTVVPDAYEDFEAYSITVTVTVSVTVKTTLQDGVKTIETTRRVTEVTVSGASGSNASFTGRALSGMQASLIDSGTADVVAGATCSSAGIRAGYAAAIAGVQLGTTTETVEQED